jgi:DNA-directed RNA polymerase specialized sigma24 family protein
MQFNKDTDLIEDCLAGDETAWEALVERYNHLVYAVPCYFQFAIDDADLIFQETFATLLSNLAKLRHTKSLARWLINTTFRECHQWQAKTGKTNSALSKTLAPELVKQWEEQQHLREAIEQMDPDCQVLLTQWLLAPATAGSAGEANPLRARQIKCFSDLEKILREMHE